jgi:hypothetical protein
MATGELEMFNEIWDERPHVSEVSGAPLLPKGHPQWHWQFAHIVSKKTYKKFMLRKDNIALVTPEEHDAYDKRGGTKDDPMWNWVHQVADQLRHEYHETFFNIKRIR